MSNYLLSKQLKRIVVTTTTKIGENQAIGTTHFISGTSDMQLLLPGYFSGDTPQNSVITLATRVQKF